MNLLALIILCILGGVSGYVLITKVFSTIYQLYKNSQQLR